jgi:hypothetical protein
LSAGGPPQAAWRRPPTYQTVGGPGARTKSGAGEFGAGDGTHAPRYQRHCRIQLSTLISSDNHERNGPIEGGPDTRIVTSVDVCLASQSYGWIPAQELPRERIVIPRPQVVQPVVIWQFATTRGSRQDRSWRCRPLRTTRVQRDQVACLFLPSTSSLREARGASDRALTQRWLLPGRSATAPRSSQPARHPVGHTNACKLGMDINGEP